MSLELEWYDNVRNGWSAYVINVMKISIVITLPIIETREVSIVKNVGIISILESGNAIHVNLQVVCEMKEYFLKCAVRRM
jgi:hypothetical protein